MTENDRLAEEISRELMHAISMFNKHNWTAEQFLQRLRLIIKAANL